MNEEKKRAEIFGENLERILKEKGMSRKEFMMLLNVSQAALALYITGKREPPLDKIFKAAKILNVSIVDLLGDNPEIKKEKEFEYRLRHARKTASSIGFLTKIIDEKYIDVYFPRQSKAITIDSDIFVKIIESEEELLLLARKELIAEFLEIDLKKISDRAAD